MKWGFLLAYIFPVLAFLGGYLGGFLLWAVPLFAFGAVPALDWVLGTDHRNPADDDYSTLSKSVFFRLVTWLYVPVQFAMIIWATRCVALSPDNGFLFAGLVLSVGITSGGVGITLSHELGHRSGKWEQFLAQTLLSSVCYMHFFIEHNLGHHRNVATHKDPATSRFGESVYRFLPRTLLGSFASAWRIEAGLLQKRGRGPWSLHNRIFGYVALPLAFTVALGLLWGPLAAVFFLLQSFVAVSLLEIINYVEHYGLERTQDPKGRFERVQPHHSWNSSYRLTNYLLFNLQRHSDHHANATRRFQTLRHFDDVPQLPMGYAGMTLLALCPPLWFAVMNPKVEQLRQQTA